MGADGLAPLDHPDEDILRQVFRAVVAAQLAAQPAEQPWAMFAVEAIDAAVNEAVDRRDGGVGTRGR
ncbi:hypothetical protein D3C72_808220 [compost metagenome]